MKKIVSADTGGIGEAIRVIAADGVVAYPTETVYGLAVNPFSEPALDALFRVKARDETHPVLLIVGGAGQIAALADTMPDRARACMKAFWPGPLSLLLPGVSSLPGRLLDDAGRFCVRCPGHPVARELCRQWGGALTSTSANLSGLPPAVTAEEAALPGVALTLDGGKLEIHAPSTVYDPDADIILRLGEITKEMIERVCP